MPARDLNHDIVRRALVSEGWTITDDPFVIRYEDLTLFADLAAERTIAAERKGQRIIVEIKGFSGDSPIREFETALGQYELYKGFLELIEPERELYLAVSTRDLENFIQRPAIQVIVERYGLHLVVVDLEKEEITSWKK